MAKNRVKINPESFFNFIRFKRTTKPSDELFIYSDFRSGDFVKKVIEGDEFDNIGIIPSNSTTTSTSTTLTTTTILPTTTTTTTTGLNFFNETDKKVSFTLTNILRTYSIDYELNAMSAKTENFNQFFLPFATVNLIKLSIFDQNTNVGVNNFNGYELVITYNNGLSVTTYANEQQLKFFRGYSNLLIFWFANVKSVRLRYSSIGTTTTTTTLPVTTTSTTSSTTSSTSTTTSTSTSSTTSTTTTLAPTTSTTTSTTSSSTTTTTSTIAGITVDVSFQNIITTNPVVDYQLYNSSDILVDSASLGSIQQKYTIGNFTLPFKFKIGLSDTSLITAQGHYNIKVYKSFNIISGNLLLDQNVLVPYSNIVFSDLSLTSDTRNVSIIVTQIDNVAPTTTTTSTSTSTTTTSTSSTTTTTTTIPITRVTFEDVLLRGLQFGLTPGSYSITPGASGFLDVPQNTYTVTITGNISNTILDLIDLNSNVVSSNPTTSGFTINTAVIRKLVVRALPTTTTTTSTSTTTTTTTIPISDTIHYLFQIDSGNFNEIEMHINLDT